MQVAPKRHFFKFDSRIVREIGKIGHVFKGTTATSYFLPVILIKHKDAPVGVYEVAELKDLPDELLAQFGVQKIPANGENV